MADADHDLSVILSVYKINTPICGAHCGAGWHKLIEALIQDLIAFGWDRDCHQIKEKFGSLRFYVGNATEEMHELISAAEYESGRVCEECGKSGKQTKVNNYWIKTLCPEHAAALCVKYAKHAKLLK